MGMDCGIGIRGLQMRRATEERFLTFVRNDGQGKEQRDFSLRRPTHSQERMRVRKKKLACSVRNDGVGQAGGKAIDRQDYLGSSRHSSEQDVNTLTEREPPLTLTAWK